MNQKKGGLRVLVDARIVTGTSGGIESFVVGLASGLSQLDGPDEYDFMTYRHHDDWLRSKISGSAAVISIDKPRNGLIRRTLRRSQLAMDLARKGRSLVHREPAPPHLADLTAESSYDILHLPYQAGLRSHLPTIFHPHDLQHIHLPQFFTVEERLRRDSLYRSMCEASQMVAVGSQWVRDDVISSFDVPEEKVIVVPLAPPDMPLNQPSESDRQLALERFDLPANFILYPAATWPHKNHIRLIEAITLLTRQGKDINLVCTGMQTDHFPEILKTIRRLGMEKRVRFLGFLPRSELAILYTMARALVIPTEFEAASFPIWEAFQAGLPVACSNVTSLPEQAGHAAVLFAPRSVGQMANSIDSVWSNESLRRQLVSRGRSRVAELSWLRSAQLFRAHYRRLAHVGLSATDMELLDAPSPI